jgi:hypothetical protein
MTWAEGMKGYGEIAAASFGWPRNDIKRRGARLPLNGRFGRNG